MSLYGALYAGVAGLQAQSNKLGIISDNVANVNTIGYKQGSANFETLVTNSGNTTAYSPGGVLGGNEQLVTTQGLLQTTSSATDIAISGSGFFVVNQKADQTGQVLYTRAGSFTQDAQGNFINAGGFFLQAWPLDRDGLLPGEPGNSNTTSSANLASLQTVNVQNLTGTASPTSSVSLSANLNASKTIFTGAGATATMDAFDTANYGIKASDLIVPSTTDKLTVGDTFQITTGSGLSYSYNYGGFTKGRDVTVAGSSSTAYGDNGLARQTTSVTLSPSATTQAVNGTTTSAPTTVTLNNAVVTLVQANITSGSVSDPGGLNSVIITASTTNLKTGDYVTIAGMTGGTFLDTNIPAAQVNGTHQITVIDSTHYYFTTVAAGATGGVSDAVTGTSFTATGNPLRTGASVSGATEVTISMVVPSGLAVGDWVNIDTGSVDGITLNGYYEVTSLDDANHFTIDSRGTGGSGNTSGGTGTIDVTPASFHTVNGESKLYVAEALPSGIGVGDYVTLTSNATTVGGITVNGGTYKVLTITDSNHYILDTGTATASSDDGDEIGTITAELAPFGTTNGSSQVVISKALSSIAGGTLVEGDFITISGVASAVNGLTLNGTYKIVDDDPLSDGLHFTIDVDPDGNTTNASSTGGGGADSTTISYTPAPIATTSGSRVISVYAPAHTLTDGDVVTLSGIGSSIGGVSTTNLNTSFVVDVVDANHYTITLPTTVAAATSSAGGGSGVVETLRPFDGNILDATNTTQPFLGVTGTSAFTQAALTFTIFTAAAGTTTFTYTATSPNSQLGQFNNMTNLVEAINDVDGLTARIVDGRIYVGASDSNAAVTFANGSVTGDDGPPVQAGIDWLRELGWNTTIATATNRFNSLSSLADQINASTGLSAEISDPLGSSSLAITVDDPLDVVTFSDASSGNTGSVLAALGIVDSLNGGTYTQQTTGSLGPSYDPSDSTKNMASGAISPPFSKPITIYDALGSPHSLNVAFLKTAANTWAVEIYSQPATDVTLTDGLIASGTIRFNGDGSLRSVSSGLTNALNITWTNQSTPSTITFNWGTTGLTDGLTQFDSGFNINSTNQNGTPVGKLTGISIDSNGFIIASYNNGQTQRLYKIPLASFTDPNHLLSISGNTYAQTNDSGEVNLKQAGDSGVGTISSGALEASNVELANQLTDMIVAQRAYQANTKVISTADQLLAALDQILQ